MAMATPSTSTVHVNLLIVPRLKIGDAYVPKFICFRFTRALVELELTGHGHANLSTCMNVSLFLVPSDQSEIQERKHVCLVPT